MDAKKDGEVEASDSGSHQAATGEMNACMNNEIDSASKW